MRNLAFLFSIGLLTATMLTATMSNSHAGIVVWGGAQNTNSLADVSTSGTFLRGFNGGMNSITVNGDAYNSFAFGQSNSFASATNNKAFLAGGSTGIMQSDKLDLLLGQATFRFSNNASLNLSTAVVDLGTFVSGVEYEIQVFYTDQRPGQGDRLMAFSSDDGSKVGGSVTLESDPNNLPATQFGQFAIGTFVADGLDPDLIVTNTNGNSAQINGWQIRTLSSVPEPTSLCTFGVVMGVICIRRRRKNG